MQCSICGWKYDQRQHEDHDLKNGLNELSLNEYQAWYKQKIKENPDFGKLFKKTCSQAELNKIVPFGFSLQRQKMVFFCHQNSIILLC